MFFVRPKDWWFYKVPPPIMLTGLLLADVASPWTIVCALGSLIVIVSLVGNFGYALNELFDVAEDQRAGRVNAASRFGVFGLQVVAAICVVGSLAVAIVATGVAGAVLTIAALLFPLAYSAPPLRLKERKWAGVFADAGAAHVYPALICILLALQNDPAIGRSAVASAVLWSAMLGLRGILTHQVLDCDQDRATGLITVVHDNGPQAIIKLICWIIAPVEFLSLVTTFVLVDTGVVVYAVGVVYLGCEFLKARMGWTGTLFSRTPARYIPFLNNAWYEVWGPLAVVSGLAARHPALIWLPPLLIAMFWSRMLTEWRMVRALALDLGRIVRSRGGDHG